MFKTLAVVTAAALIGGAPLTSGAASAEIIRQGGGTSGHFSRGMGGGGFASRGFAGHAFGGRSLGFGRFASHGFAGNFGRALGGGTWRHSFTGHARIGNNLAPHSAMGTNFRGQQGFDHSHGWFAGRDFRRGNIGWAGPVFWPYAYNDLFDYAFDPYYDGFDGGLFWAYGYDDLFAGVLLPYVAGAMTNGGGSAPIASNTTAPTSGAATPSSSLAACASNTSIAGGVSIDDIRNAVHPTADQGAKLDALKTAEANGEKTLADACTAQSPTTAEARLDAVDARLQAMNQALDQTQGPLNDFYSSLNDEQKAAFNAIGDKSKTPTQTAAAAPSLAQMCGPQNAVPVIATDKIDKAVAPDAKQQQSLAALSDAANKADQTILASCPAQAPLTPTGRLDAVRGRLQAMIKGVDTIKPALHDFYASLSDPQKSRFDALTEPPTSAQNTAGAHT